MLPTRLILIRHGHTDRGRPARLDGWTDVPLSALGLAQAARLCARLAAEDRPDALYVSSLQRARDTARPLAEALGVEPRPCAAIREIGCGLVDGWPLAAVERSYPDLLRTNERRACRRKPSAARRMTRRQSRAATAASAWDRWDPAQASVTTER